MTTLVLGGTGFIGSRIVHKLVALGEQVVCLDIFPEASSVHVSWVTRSKSCAVISPGSKRS